MAIAIQMALGAFGMAGGNAMAQAAPEAEAPKVQRIEVTGSSIKRIEGETALPIQTISRAAIEKSGANSAEQLLASLSANVGAFTESASISDVPGKSGFSGANLRGLGVSSTLVLLNGRRMANYAFGGDGVDLSSIPMGAIDRVEVLKDGASAVYGADAVGGVINFITRKDYRGAEISVSAGGTQHGGAGTKGFSLAGGWGDLVKDRFNVFGNFQYRKNEELRSVQRGFAKTAYYPADGIDFTSAATFPANITNGARGPVIANPSAPNCNPPSSIYIAAFKECAFDYQSMANISPPSEKMNLIGRAVFALNEDNRLFAEFSASQNDAEYRISPANARLVYPANGKYYPTGLGLKGNLNIRLRFTPVGQRITSQKSEQQRLVFGAEGSLAGWDYSAAVNHSVSDSHERYKQGYLSGDKLRAAMATGNINPFGPSDAAGQALFESTQLNIPGRSGNGTTDAFDLRASRELMALPGGPLALALGAEFRREKMSDTSSAEVKAGAVINSHESPDTFGSRTVKALFSELSVPIVKNLEAQLALRYDSYSGNIGSTLNPKVALRWQPSKQMLFRTAYGTGFRAPTLADINSAQVFGSTAGLYVDPLRCINGAGPGCRADQLDATFSGNKNLKPEKSKQFSLGMLVEPVPSLSVGLDYWMVKKTDVIKDLAESLIVSNYASIANHITRAAPDAANPNLPGAITNVDLPKSNQGAQNVSGIDVELVHRLKLDTMGRLTTQLSGTYITKSENQLLKGGAFVSNLGVFAGDYATPRWRHNLSVSWDKDAWGATLSNSFQLGYTDQNLTPAGQTRRVGSYSLWNLQGSYTGIKNVKVSAGINNLFDTDPPFSNQSLSYLAGYDSSYTDPRGRNFYVKLSYSFK